MDILLIDPPFMSLKGVSTDCGYHMGLVCLAAFLASEGIDSSVLMGDLIPDTPPKNVWNIINYKTYAKSHEQYASIVNDKHHVVWKRIADFVMKNDPLVVGISYLTPERHTVERVAELVKEIDNNIKIVVGSSHPTCCPEEVMQNPNIDFVISGEGEIPLFHLVKEIKKANPKWETVPGLHYRDNNGNIVQTYPADLISNLDKLPYPARHLVLNCDYSRYRDHAITTARGCPYACSFCADKKLWGGEVRRRTVDNVIEELVFLKQTYKINQVDFIDGTFTYDRNYLQTFCNKLISSELNINWRCTARYDNLDEQLIRLMKKANCSGLYFGLESGSNRILTSTNKKITVEDNIKMSKIVHESGIFSAAAVLLGLPSETKEDLEATLKLMKNIKVDSFDVNSYVPLPGSILFDSMGEEEKRNIDWRKVSMKSYGNHFIKSMSHEEFNSYLNQAYDIADRLHKKTFFRVAVRMPFQYISRKINQCRHSDLYQ